MDPTDLKDPKSLAKGRHDHMPNRGLTDGRRLVGEHITHFSGSLDYAVFPKREIGCN